MAVVHRNPPPSIPLGRTPPDPCPVEYSREGHNVPGQHYCPSCGKRYCVYHCIPTAHGCRPPDITEQRTRLMAPADGALAAWGRLHDDAVWQYLLRQIEGDGMAVVLKRHGYAVGIVVLKRRTLPDRFTFQYQYFYRALDDQHLFESSSEASPQALVNGMPTEHKATLYHALLVQMQREMQQREQQMDAPVSVLDVADARQLVNLGIPDVRGMAGFVPAVVAPPIVDAIPPVLSPAEKLADLDARDPRRTRTLPLPVVEEDELS